MTCIQVPMSDERSETEERLCVKLCFFKLHFILYTRTNLLKSFSKFLYIFSLWSSLIKDKLYFGKRKTHNKPRKCIVSLLQAKSLKHIANLFSQNKPFMNVHMYSFREYFCRSVFTLFNALQTLAALHFEPRCPPSGWILKSRRMSQESHTQNKLCFMDRFTSERWNKWVQGEDNTTELRGSPLISLSHTQIKESAILYLCTSEVEYLKSDKPCRDLDSLVSKVFCQAS